MKIKKVDRIHIAIPLTASGKPAWIPDTLLGFYSYCFHFLTCTLLHCLFLVMSGRVDFLGKNRLFQFIMIIHPTKRMLQESS